MKFQIPENRLTPAVRIRRQFPRISAPYRAVAAAAGRVVVARVVPAEVAPVRLADGAVVVARVGAAHRTPV